MENRKKIYSFAEKWLKKFADPHISCKELLDQELAEDCQALGFQMDCGHGFSRLYGSAVYDGEALEQVISQVEDMELLGSAIYSRWRYFNHWAYDPAQVLEEKNRGWFLTALGRLKELSRAAFSGTLRRFRLITRVLTPAGEAGETLQQLTLNSRGQVWLTGEEPGGKTGTLRSGLGADLAGLILKAIQQAFQGKPAELRAPEGDCWILELLNTEGESFSYAGPLGPLQIQDGIDLSDLIRNGLDMGELLAFDGNRKQDRVEQIQVDYRRVRQLTHEGESFTWEYREQVRLDRGRQQLTLTQQVGSGCRITHSYEAEGVIEEFLDSLDPDRLFTRMSGLPDCLEPLPGEERTYRITLKFRYGQDREITGSYDRYGLPGDFGKFADAVAETVRFFGLCEMLSPQVYGQDRRRTDGYIFCSVEFPWGSRTYYYLADEEGYQVGDRVVVPVGQENIHRAAVIREISRFAPDQVPMPVEKVKHIIRRLPPED